MAADPRPNLRLAEAATLGALLQNNQPLAEGGTLGWLGAEHFHDPNHRLVFDVISGLVGDGRTADLVTVTAAAAGRIDASFLASLTNRSEDSARAAEYALPLRERHGEHQLATIGKELQRLASNGTPPAVIVNQLRSQIDNTFSFITSLPKGSERKETIIRPAADVVREAPRPDWAVQHLLARGAVSFLEAPIKLGKTTLALSLARSRGGQWCELAVVDTPVLYLTEQGQTSFAAQLDAAGLAEAMDLHVMFITDAPPTWEGRLRVCADFIADHHVGVLVIDTLSRWAGLRDENDNAEADRAMQPLHKLVADTDVGCLCNRHARKSGGEVAEAGRGASSWAGNADILISLTSGSGSRRRLEVVGRFSSPAPFVVERDPAGTSPVLMARTPGPTL